MFHNFKVSGEIESLFSGRNRRIRVFKQSKPELQSEYSPDRLVNGLLTDLSLFHKLFKIIEIAQVGHIHIQPGIDCPPGRFLMVSSGPLINELLNCIPVRYYHSIPSELFLKHLSQMVW